MAIRGVNIVQPQDEVQTKKARKGGGEIGTAIGAVAGGVVGAMAGTATGGPGWGTAQGAMLGASGGGSLGGQIGERISPSRQESTAITRRMAAPGMQPMQSENSETLKQSIMALRTQPPEIQKEYAKPLVDAYMTSVAKSGIA